MIKEINFDLEKAEARLHIVKGLLIALEDIDNVIALIKTSASGDTARTKLMDKYKIDEIQAKSILAMRLSSLADSLIVLRQKTMRNYLSNMY